jgi:hypothetical protein
MQLLHAAREAGSEIVAFCDQDDVWFPNKIADGVKALSKVSGPALYCSGVILADESLGSQRPHRAPRKPMSFSNALVENVATGATIMLNEQAIKLAGQYIPRRAVMHDAWLYLLISGTGTVIYDPRPSMLYRQHGANAIGVDGGLRSWQARAVRQIRGGHQRVLSAQAMEFKERFGSELTSDASSTLDAFLLSSTSLGQRLRFACSNSAYRHRRVDDVIFRLLYVLRRL